MDENEARRRKEKNLQTMKRLKADLDRMPESMTDVMRQLEEIKQAYMIASEGSNIGSADFEAYMDRIIKKMDGVRKAIDKLGSWEYIW